MGGITQPSSGFGIGQNWGDVTGSRSIGSSYTNNTGKPIMVIIAATSNGVNGLFNVLINNAVSFLSPSGYISGAWTTVSFVVPNGQTYSTSQQGSNVTLQKWLELS